jgi:multiple sugar transport system substrate-binding protein
VKKSMLLFLAVLFIFASAVSALAGEKEITFWTTEVEKDRVGIQKEIAAEFSQRTGINVRVIPVEENLLVERVTAAYAARSLPDVIFLPIDFTIGWAEAGILDYQSSTEVVMTLGRETFGTGPLKLARFKDGYAAVPADGWGQLLLYRRDLFEKKALPVPDRWDAILKASRTLHNPPLIWGFEVATDPGQTYTQQVFEHFALSNGVKLTDSTGQVNLNTPEMVETLEFYKKLAAYTPPGNLYWLHTRMDYLSGRAAMIVWSPFILDELSGLRQDQPVVPDIAKGEPGFLARHTGFVTTIHGPKGKAQYGQINYFGITRDADKKAAMEWVKFLLSEGYLKWLSLAAEGKLPVRLGTKEDPEKFTKGWMGLEFGVTTRAKISRFYGADVVKTIMNGVESFDRWGFSEGKGALVSKIYGTKVIPEILKKFLDDEITAQEAAQIMNARVRELQ